VQFLYGHSLLYEPVERWTGASRINDVQRLRQLRRVGVIHDTLGGELQRASNSDVDDNAQRHPRQDFSDRQPWCDSPRRLYDNGGALSANALDAGAEVDVLPLD